MSLFGKKKKRKKYGKKELSGNRKRFSETERYADDYEEEEYYEEEYDEEEYYEEEYDEDASEEYDAYDREPDGEYIREGYYEESGEYDEDGAYYEEEYYGDDVDYYGEDEEEGNSYEEDGLYYIDDGEYEDDEEDDGEDFVAYRKKKGVSGALLAFKNLPFIDKVIAFTGAAVLIFALVTGVIFMAAKNEEKAVAAFNEVGTSLNDIKIIGESGLLAVADARMAKEAAAAKVEEETQVVEEQPVQSIGVILKMTSIVKDLKIKFVNASSDKLVPNVPFKIEVTTPSKKTETWTDDDKDGVIYKENIAPGAYQVKMLELDAAYADYKVSVEVQKVEVKENIDYKKVDVKEEIKTEAEVNAAVEDTAVAEVVEESKLTDTVPFVKSTQTNGGAVSYQPIGKDKIKDPGATARIETAGYYLMTEGTVSPNNPEPAPDPEPEQPQQPEKKKSLFVKSDAATIKVGDTAKIEATSENIDDIEWSVSGDSSVATLEKTSAKTATIKGVGKGEVTVTAKESGGEISASCKITVTKEPSTLKIDPATLSLTVNTEGVIKVTESNQTAFDWKSSDVNVATVTSEDGGKTAKIKALKVGKTTITVTAEDAGPEKCEVTVTDAGVTADKTSVKVAVKKTADIKITTVPDSAKITEVVFEKKEIATAAVKDKIVTITGAAVGKTNITIKCSNGKEVNVALEVVGNAELDTTSLLKDQNGNQVYVCENGKYRQAVYADYYKFKEFYLETKETLYTGWQNINGKTYYYLEDHRYVTGEQVIQGAKYTFASDGSLVTSSGTFGIDVSKWNGSIDWNSVKSSGAAYAIIRCGYRGSTTGALITDPKFAANIAGANAAGLKVGVYFFTQAVNEKEAVEEASMVLDLVKKYKVSYPVFLDVESSGGRADKIDKGTRTAVCKAFCATIQNSGYTAGIYANKTWLASKMDSGALGAYKIWLAQYAAAPNYSGRYNLWQYSAKGSVPGIKGNVDLNLSYLGY